MDGATAHAELDELPRFPQLRTCPFGIAPAYGELRETEPIARVKTLKGETVWLITKYEYAREILASPGVSSDRTHPRYPVPPPFINREVMLRAGKALVSMDPPEHTFHRHIMVSEFTVKRLNSLRPRIQEMAEGCVNKLLASSKPADLVEILSQPIPSQVICVLLGVPYEQRPFFEARTKVVVSRKRSDHEKVTALLELHGFVGELVARKETEGGNDLLGRLIDRYRKAGAYDRDTLIALTGLLLTGGQDTTASTIALGALALIEHPDQLEAIRQDPGLMPVAVEEFLRYFSVSADTTGHRVALRDIEIGGVTIHEGDGIVSLVSAANRDPDIFADPEKLDIRRGARHHLGFGYGIHQCLGQNLSRIEIEIALGTLFRRIPDLRLAIPLDEVPFKYDANVYGVDELPVTW
jgi:cytochrome P450